MSNNKIWRVLAATVVFFMLGAYGCILNPTEDTQPPPPVVIDWPDLTEKDDCIETILLLYNNYNKLGDVTNAINARYANVLYNDVDDLKDYVWHMSEVDQAKYPPILSRQEDIDGTIYLLSNASQMTMTIPVATWDPATELCDNCWMTTRFYTFSCTVNHKGESLSFQGNQVQIEFVVGPHHNDPNKWAIYQATDKKTSGT